MLNISSSLLKEVVYQFTKLPGLGYRSALDLAVYLLKNRQKEAKNLITAINRLLEDIKICELCGNISERELCEICSSPKRDRSLICVVEDFLGIIAIESTDQYYGLYHVLNGLIAPMDGVGPEQLNMEGLYARISSDTKEVIFALNSSPEGDTTTFYLARKLMRISEIVQITTLSRGISPDSEIEYTNPLTLAKSLQNRVLYR